MRGFTLIEILIVIVIMGLVIGMALPAFQTFQQSQTFDQGVKDFVNTLNIARSDATSNVQCSTTNRAKKFEISITSSGYTLQAICESSINPLTAPIPKNITFTVVTGTTTVDFVVPVGNDNTSHSITLTNALNSSQTKTVTISTTGVVSVN